MKKLFVIITVSALAGCFGKDPVKSGKEGKPMPEFSMLLTDSTTWVRSTDIPKGSPTVLFYFSPHCPYCKSQTKDIVENIDKLKNIHFYLISDFSFSLLNDFKRKFHLERYPNITVGRDTTDNLPNYFEISGVPYLAIYKKDKTLIQSFAGKTYISQIKKAIEE